MLLSFITGITIPNHFQTYFERAVGVQRRSEVLVVVRKGGIGSFLDLGLVLRKQRLVDCYLGRSEGRRSNEFLGRALVHRLKYPIEEGVQRLTRAALPTSLRASQRNGFSKL
jgi:hypothetical protein